MDGDTKRIARAQSRRVSSVEVCKDGRGFCVRTIFAGGVYLSQSSDDYESAYRNAVDVRNKYDLDGIKVRGAVEEGRRHVG